VGALDSDISDMMEEAIGDLGRTITYYKRSPGSSINTATMTRAYTTTATISVAAIRSPGRSEDVGRGAVTEFVYTLRKSDLGASVVPDRNDQISDTVGPDTFTLSVTNIETDANDLAWRITARFKRNES
jgi:hypothetical protein